MISIEAVVMGRFGVKVIDNLNGYKKSPCNVDGEEKADIAGA
jgi:hypothetical protein